MDTFASGREYISCPWIEGGLVFGRGLFHVCCIAHHEDGGWMPIAPFDQNSTVPLAAVRQVRDELRRANQRDGHERCRGCANLRRQRWTPRHVFDTLNFSHFTQCNLECGYCYLQRQVVPGTARQRPDSALPVVRAMIKECLLSPNAVVHWGGGEPTLLQEFEKLLALLAEHGCTSIVNTNGTVYSAALRDSLENGVAFVVCSVDAGTPVTYAKLKGHNYYDRVLSHLGRYAETAPDRVSAKYLFLRDNLGLPDLTGFVDSLRSYGVRRVVCDIDEGLRELPAEMAEAIARLIQLCHRSGIAVDLGGCGALRMPEFRLREKVAAALQHQFGVAKRDRTELVACQPNHDGPT